MNSNIKYRSIQTESTATRWNAYNLFAAYVVSWSEQNPFFWKLSFKDIWDSEQIMLIPLNLSTLTHTQYPYL